MEIESHLQKTQATKAFPNIYQFACVYCGLEAINNRYVRSPQSVVQVISAIYEWKRIDGVSQHSNIVSPYNDREAKTPPQDFNWKINNGGKCFVIKNY